jgi:hypothetical protein
VADPEVPVMVMLRPWLEALEKLRADPIFTVPELMII